MKVKNSLIAAIVVIALFGGVMGAIDLFDKNEAELPVDFNIENYIDVEELAGDRGPMGPRGLQGIPGVGLVGLQGPAGASVAIEDVLAALDAREASEDEPFVFSGAAGNFVNSIELEDLSYDIVSRHFGAEDFYVSLVDEDGNVSVVLSSNGHLSDSSSFNADEGDYELRVSASGDWSVEID